MVSPLENMTLSVLRLNAARREILNPLHLSFKYYGLRPGVFFSFVVVFKYFVFLSVAHLLTHSELSSHLASIIVIPWHGRYEKQVIGGTSDGIALAMVCSCFLTPVIYLILQLAHLLPCLSWSLLPTPRTFTLQFVCVLEISALFRESMMTT